MNTFINARAHPEDFYLQIEIPEFIESVLVTIVEREGKKTTVNSIKKIDAWLGKLLTIRVSLGRVA